MFGPEVTKALVAAAKANGIRPAALLAVVEVETAGKTFEQDGKTPQLLLERHKIYSEAKKVSKTKLAAFVRAGLAHPDWRRSTQYQDQRTSAQRLALLGRACEIDEEITKRACSWGIGQTMGFLAEEIGFPNAIAMVRHQTGSLSGQIDCMLREIKRKHLVEAINQGDYAHFALIYNGPKYGENNYDTRLADADKRWTRRLENTAPKAAPPPEAGLSRDEILIIQRSLSDLGYAEVGMPDGVWGSRTTGAVAAFQAHEGLPVSGHMDEITKQALLSAQPRPVARERAEAGIADLAGSKTIQAAEKVSFWGKLKLWLAGLIGIGTAADTSGMLDVDAVQDGVEKVQQVSSIWQTVAPVLKSIFHGPAVYLLIAVLLIAGTAVLIHAARVKMQRLKDHQSGFNSMTSGD